MAGIDIATDLNPEDSLKIVKRVAREMGFTIEAVDEWELSLQMGSLVASIFLGAFIAYCNFRVFIEEKRKRVTISIERNTPWWTGFIGVSRVKTKARTLADLIVDDIVARDGEVFDRIDS